MRISANLTHLPLVWPRVPLLCTLLVVSLSTFGPQAHAQQQSAATSTATFETPEYFAQRALPIVKAASLYARGGTGKGVTVALIDSGLNSNLESFKDRLADPGYDFVRQSEGTLDRLGHGTQMAGIIAANKDERGIHGIAYEAQIVALRFGDDKEPFAFDDEIAKSWRFAFDKGARIFSNSWANSIPATEITESRYRQVMEASLQQARELVANGAVFVFPTGNELKREPLAEPGLPLAVPELEKGWLAVVALKNDGTAINGKSNYCGVARRWCIAVPGGDSGAGLGLLTTGMDGTFIETAGTSPATALVAGALAALQSRYPLKTPQQIRDLLLSTTNRTGIYANQEAYGQGLMDLEIASREEPQSPPAIRPEAAPARPVPTHALERRDSPQGPRTPAATAPSSW